MLHRIACKSTWLSFQRLPHSLPFIRHHVPHGIVFLLRDLLCRTLIGNLVEIVWCDGTRDVSY